MRRSRARSVADSRDGTVLIRHPPTHRWQVAVSIQNLTRCPARAVPSQNILAAFDTFISRLEAARPLRPAAELKDFRNARTSDYLRIVRSELVVGGMLAAVGVGFDFGARGGTPQPDLVLRETVADARSIRPREDGPMSHVRRFNHVGLTVADLDVVTAFFVALGLEVEGRTFVEGEFLDTVCGIPGSRIPVGTEVGVRVVLHPAVEDPCESGRLPAPCWQIPLQDEHQH